ncbi:hypothetical protein V6N11_029174 [Hibiscus sabdariffa]
MGTSVLLACEWQKLLTNLERTCRHLVSSTLCPICNTSDKSVEHVLCSYHMARSIWSQLIHASKWLEFISMPLDFWLMVNLRGRGNFAPTDYNWSVLFPMVTWKLWKRRCNVLFDVHFVEKRDFLLLACCLAKESEASNVVCKARRRSELRIVTSDI